MLAVSSPSEKLAHRKLYYETKQIFYQNAHSLLVTNGYIEGFVREAESFNITEYLNYLMELHNIAARERGVVLTLKLEPCFPKEVAGERLKFELVLSAILVYLISQTEKEKEIVLEAKLKNPNEDGLLLAFEFSAPLSSRINTEHLGLAMDTTLPSSMDPRKAAAMDFRLGQCRSIVRWLRGSIEVVPVSAQLFGVNVDVQFANCDNSGPIGRRKSLGLFETNMVNKYTRRWMEPVVIHKSEEKEENKLRPTVPNITAQLKDKILRAVKANRDRDKTKEGLTGMVKDEIRTKILNRTVLYNLLANFP